MNWFVVSALLLSLTCADVPAEGDPHFPTSYFTESPVLINNNNNNNNPSLFDCSWTTSTGYSIDLSQLYGAVLSYSSSKSSYIYYYSPCNDGVICTQNSSNFDTMAIQDDGTGFCISYLAKYDAFVSPVYSVSSETFTFEYNNGEISDICDNPRQLIIKWICDPQYEYKIDSVTEIASCIYELSINSYLACVNQTASTTTTTTTTKIPNGCKFGMYDYYDSDAIEPDGWYRVSLDLFNYYKNIFVTYYNKHEGIECIKSWDTCGNCCFAVDEGEYLTVVNGNMDNYECDVLPAIAPDDYECCPIDGYIEGETYIFDRKNYGEYLINISRNNLTFGSIDRCADNHNPAVYQKNCW